MNNHQLSVISYQSSVIRKQKVVATILFFFAIIFLSTIDCSLFTVRAETPPLSREQRLEIFDDVWETIDERYYDANLRGVDWQAERNKFRDQAAAARDSAELYRILKTMVGALRDSHTRVFAPEEKSDWRNPRFVGVGASVREIENQLVFVSVEKDSLAERSGIKPGDLLVSIEDVSAANVLARRLAQQPGASTAAITRLRAVAGVFEGAVDSFVRVGFRRSNREKTRFAALKREWHVAPASVRTERQGDTLVIAFDVFAPDIVQEFYQTLQSDLRGVRGIVLDLRVNRGGSTEAMADIASAFLPEQQLIGKFIDRAGKVEVEAATRRWLLYSANLVKVPAIPIVVLTSTATASAAEIFAATLRNSNRARVIGAPTCGCVLAVRGQHPLSDGGVLEISELDFQLPTGTRLEGAGVAVDERIWQTRRDLLARRDPVLERAFKLIKS